MAEIGEVSLTVNGQAVTRRVAARVTLADFLRDELGLTGTHLGCEHGVCGACTILLDGRSVRSCLLFAVQAEGHRVETVEGLAGPDEPMDEIQEAFSTHHALQCGFCTPGFLMTVKEYLAEDPRPDERDIRERLSGNICRCTGYQSIVEAMISLIERSAASPQSGEA